MGERVGVDPAARLLLDPVVAHRSGRVDRLVDLVGVVELAAGVGVVGPHPGQAVGLQLEPHRQGVGLRGVALLTLTDLVGDAEDVLQVVPVLVGDDVLGGQVTGGAELVLQLEQEVEVEVHLRVGRTVEGPHVGVGRAAAGGGAPAEEHRLGELVLTAGRGERAVPELLDVALAAADDLGDLGVARPRAGGRGVLRFGVGRQPDRRHVARGHARPGTREELREEGHRQHHQEAEQATARLDRDAEPAAPAASTTAAGEREAEPAPSAAALAAAVFDHRVVPRPADLGHVGSVPGARVGRIVRGRRRRTW